MTPSSKGARPKRASGSRSGATTSSRAGKKKATGKVAATARKRPALPKKKAAPVVKKAATTTKKTAPSAPGGRRRSILFSSDTGGISSIPVTLRAMVDVAHGGAFSGVLTGGNGRAPGEGQEQYYEFNVGTGSEHHRQRVAGQRRRATRSAAYLVSPDGDTLGYGQNNAQRRRPR